MREEQGLECRDASANDTDVCFNGRPYPDLVPFPGCIVCLEQCVVDPVRSEAAGNNNKTANGKENDQSEALTPWK